ncbi:MAG: hypothetical protein AAFX56_08045 [Pseudomonadota bacterium]
MNGMNDALRTLAGVLVLAVVCSGSANAGERNSWQCEREPLTSFWEQDIAGHELSGRGKVCASKHGVLSHMRVRGLTPGNAYTVWWVYIDNPDSCAGIRLTPENSEVPFAEPSGYAGRCGLADFFTPNEAGDGLDPLAVFGRMDSAVAENARRTWFVGDLRGLTPSPGSQVWMLVFGHGPADVGDGRQLARQLLTPEDPGTGAPHLGIEGRPYGYPAGVVVVDMD